MKLKRNIQIATRMDLYFDSVFFSIFELRQSFSLIADHGECPFRCTTRSTNQNCVLIPLACQFYNIFRCFYYSIYNLQLNFIQIFKFYQRYKEKCWKLRMILIFFLHIQAYSIRLPRDISPRETQRKSNFKRVVGRIFDISSR